MPPQQEQSRTKVSPGDALALFYNLSAIHVAALSPIIRSDHGSESFGLRAIAAVFVMAAFTDARWASPMGVYMTVWFVFLIYRRIETLRNWRTGKVTHSRFIGFPWLASKFRFIKSPEQARNFEPFMCLLLGAALAFFTPVVGFFVMGGFVSIAACGAIEQFGVHKRVQHMKDAQIEGEYFAEEFKRGR